MRRKLRRAAANLRTFCERHLAGGCDIEVVDVHKEPGRVLEEGVLLTPMLTVLSKSGVCSLVGNLSDAAPLPALPGLSGEVG